MAAGCGSFRNLSAPGEVEGRDRKALDAHRLAIPAYTVVNKAILSQTSSKDPPVFLLLPHWAHKHQVAMLDAFIWVP